MSRGKEAGRYGSVHYLADGRVSVRFERALPYSVETVWAALTEQDQLDAWMPGVRFERRQGGHYEIWFGGECEGPAHVSGSVEAFEPPNVLQLGTIRWELSETTDGCLLIFTDVLVFQEGTVFEAATGQEWVFEVAQFEREVETWRLEAKKKSARGVRQVRRSGELARRA